MKPKIEINSRKEKLLSDNNQIIDVLVRIKTPKLETDGLQRPKLNLGISLDRSGSMGGVKMQAAIEASKYIVNEMLPHDRLSVVIFDDQVDVLFTNQFVTDKEMMNRGIGRIEARRSTALFEGWRTAALQVSEYLDYEMLNRVILITDGNANHGLTDEEQIIDHARELAERGVSTSTIGCGADFNENLLLGMGESGNGNSWLVKEPQDMVKIFETEMLGLVTQIGHNATLRIRPADGVKVVEILNDLETDSNGRYKLPNLQAGAVLDLIIRLNVPAHSAGRVEHLAEFELKYNLQDSGEVERVTSSFEIAFEPAYEIETLSENTEVLKAVQMLMNARVRKEAMERMDEGDYSGARGSLKAVAASTGVLFSQMASPDLLLELNDLEELDESLKDRDNDPMARKLLAYQREYVRKGK